MTQKTFRRCTSLLLLAIGFVIVRSESAHAQSLKMPASLFVAGAVADVVTTYGTLNAGGYERNPIWAPLKTAPKVTAGMLAADAVALYVAHRLNRKHHRLAVTALLIGAAGSFTCALTNIPSWQEQNRLKRTGLIRVY